LLLKIKDSCLFSGNELVFEILCSRYKPTNQVKAIPAIYAPVNHGYNDWLASAPFPGNSQL